MFRKRKSILYFAPHQDDELLSMGIHICSSVRKKLDVHVILCSDGSKSIVRNILKNRKTCSKHEGMHQYDLTIEEFIQARDREFIDSCLALGVKRENIHIPINRNVDGFVNTTQIENLMTHFVALYGKDSVICTLSPTNGTSQHQDHKALGLAAERLLNRGVVGEVNFFIEPYHFTQIVDNARLIPIEPTIKPASVNDKMHIKKAIDAYSYWNPDEQRYACGYHSVTTEFNDFFREPKCYYYTKYSPVTINSRQQLDWNHKKWRKLWTQKQSYFSAESCDTPDLGNMLLINVPAYDEQMYRKICDQYNIQFTDKNMQRIKDGSSFWALATPEGEAISSIWVAYQQKFYIGETDYLFQMDHSKTAIFYDANTIMEHRGKGLYGLLLQSVISNYDGPECFIIYTSLDNQSSSKGILKADFRFDGDLSASDGSLKRYLKKQGFTSITRKTRFWGLKVSK